MAAVLERSWENEYECIIPFQPPASEIIVPRIIDIPSSWNDFFFVDFSPVYQRPFFRGFDGGLPVGHPSQVQPASCSPRYRAWQDPEGRIYYEDLETGSTDKHLPGAKAQKKDLQVGMCIELCTQEGKQWYEQCTGEIILFCLDKALVCIPDYWTEVVVSQDQIRPLSMGRLVKLQNGGHLTNGIMQRALRDQRTQEIMYEVANGPSVLRLRPLHLRSPRFDGLEQVLQNPPGELKEFLVTFVMPGLQKEEHFNIHVPPKFQMVESKLQMDKVAKWPLLIYLHGSGGGTFLSFTKRSLPCEGGRYAAEHFIIVSPHCTWKWKASPLPWVLTLVRELRKMPYVDSSRIYLTGVSMGGMGCWELAMQDPNLFAAVAPVAGYHKEWMRSDIAQALKATPIFAVNSRKDTTCPLAPEMKLYEELQLHRACLRVDLCNSAHTEMHRAHMDDTTLYEWMLSYPESPEPVKAPTHISSARRWLDKTLALWML